MNSMKRLLAALLVGGAGFALFVACGPTGGDDCLLDADCAEGQACEEQECVATCTGDADCGAGEVCRVGDNTSLMVCKADSGNNTSTNNMSTNNTSTNNSTMRDLYYTVKITSTTNEAVACENANDNDPGPDIFGVALQDETGNVLGWGNWVGDDIDFGSDHADVGVVDGSPLDLGGDLCPDMFDGNVVSLGCPGEVGAFIVVDFLDSDGTPVPINGEDNRQITVYEWGGQCTSGTVTDTYNVDACTDTDAVKNDFVYDSCTVSLLVDGEGETTANVGAIGTN